MNVKKMDFMKGNRRNEKSFHVTNICIIIYDLLNIKMFIKHSLKIVRNTDDFLCRVKVNEIFYVMFPLNLASYK